MLYFSCGFMVCSFRAMARALLLVKAGANWGKGKQGGTALRFPSLALSRSGTKGISHPEADFQDP
jgi:hypothetical protein